MTDAAPADDLDSLPAARPKPSHRGRGRVAPQLVTEAAELARLLAEGVVIGEGLPEVRVPCDQPQRFPPVRGHEDGHLARGDRVQARESALDAQRLLIAVGRNQETAIAGDEIGAVGCNDAELPACRLDYWRRLPRRSRSALRV